MAAVTLTVFYLGRYFCKNNNQKKKKWCPGAPSERSVVKPVVAHFEPVKILV